MTISQTQTVEFKIEGMDCSGCVRSVEGAVRALAGVQAVTVSLDDNNAMVTLEPALVSNDAIVDAIEAVGFDVVK